MNNVYLDSIKNFEAKIKKYVDCILKCYGYELQLLLSDYNLLARQDNTIESSTAIGYSLEEFIVAKLILFTQKHDGKSDFKITPNNKTTQASYDCSSEIGDIFAMINIKVEKCGSSNNAVAAINQLHKDYCQSAPNKEKCFMVLKLKYSFAKLSTNRVIKIDDIDSYFLEEYDFTSGHSQDHRSWSSATDNNAGRLQVTQNFRNSNKLKEDQISYKNFFKSPDSIFQNNLK